MHAGGLAREQQQLVQKGVVPGPLDNPHPAFYSRRRLCSAQHATHGPHKVLYGSLCARYRCRFAFLRQLHTGTYHCH